MRSFARLTLAFVAVIGCLTFLFYDQLPHPGEQIISKVNKIAYRECFAVQLSQDPMEKSQMFEWIRRPGWKEQSFIPLEIKQQGSPSKTAHFVRNGKQFSITIDGIVGYDEIYKIPRSSCP